MEWKRRESACGRALVLRVRLWLGALHATGAAATATGASTVTIAAAAAPTGAAAATATGAAAAAAPGAAAAAAPGAAATAATGAAATAATGTAAAAATGAVKVTKAASRWCPRRRGCGRGRRTLSLAPAADFASIGTAVTEAHTQAVAIASAPNAFALLADLADSLVKFTRDTHARI